MALIGTRRERIIRSAEKLVARGRLRSAIKEYRKALKDAPDDTNTLNRVGDLYARLNQVPEAVDLFRQIAGIYERDGFSVKAIAIYKKILRLDSSQTDIHGTLGDLYRRQGLIIEARSQYSVLAEEQRAALDLEGARNLHRKMLELEPRGIGNMAVLVDLLAQLGELDEARDGYRFMADRMLQHGDAEAGERIYLSALGSEVGGEEFAGAAVDHLRLKGEAESAERVLNAAIERFPDSTDLADRVGAEVEPVTAVESPEIPPPAPATEGDAGHAAVEPPDAPTAEIDRPDETRPQAEDGPPAEEVEIELDLDQIERQVVPSPTGEDPSTDPADTASAELLAEVEVFVKYGMGDKAIERLEAILEEYPSDPTALDRLARLHLEAESHVAAARFAAQLAERATAVEIAPLWDRLADDLRAAGFAVEGSRVEPPSAEIEVAVEPEEVAAPQSGESVEANVAWLEDLAQETRPAEPDRMFDSEDEFFDLAAELEDELDSDVELAVEAKGDSAAAPSLDRIVDTFRQKIGAKLSESDYDTHYNLGIAYREMGLLDESITEFQLAAKDSRYLVDCCSLLGTSFLEKGFPDLAVKWYRRGLEAPTTESSESLGLLYELGSLYQSIGDVSGAQESYSRIHETNPGYRDVTARLQALEPSSES